MYTLNIHELLVSDQGALRDLLAFPGSRQGSFGILLLLSSGREGGLGSLVLAPNLVNPGPELRYALVESQSRVQDKTIIRQVP